MYYYGVEAVVGYLRNNLPVFDAMPDCFKCKNTEFANDNVCVVEAGRSKVNDTFEGNLVITWKMCGNSPSILNMHILDAARQARKISVNTKYQGMLLIDMHNIICVEAVRNNCVLYLVNGKVDVIESISELIRILGEAFLRVHRSYLVNPHYIKSIQRCSLIMENELYIPIPEKKYTETKRNIANFVNMCQ